MDEKQERLSELQEIIFWQQLNTQLIFMQKRGVAISDAHQKFIQKFCFDTRLFSKVTEVPLMDEIPMSLITDFSNFCFFTVKVDSWTDWLRQLLPKVVVLDIEDALSDAFDALGQYDKRYHLTKDEDEDDNETLYNVIGQFLDLKESYEYNFSDIVLKTYELKYKTLSEIVNMIDGNESWQISATVSGLNLEYFGNADDKSFFSINKLYYDEFCLPLRKMTSDYMQLMFELCNVRYPRRYNELPRGKLPYILNSKERNKLREIISRAIEDRKIKEFIDSETTLLSQESAVLKKFWSNIFRRGKNSNRIKIYDFYTFDFLKNPFPVI